MDDGRFDLLAMVEYKSESNINAGDEWRHVTLGSVHVNYHPSRPWWWSGRLAAKQVDERFPVLDGGVQASYKAWLLGGRLVYDMTENWDLGLLMSVMQGGAGSGARSRQTAVGVEAGYLMRQNVWLSAGYNISGFRDRDLSNDYTAKGAYLRLRFKFDQQLFGVLRGDESAPKP